MPLVSPLVSSVQLFRVRFQKLSAHLVNYYDTISETHLRSEVGCRGPHNSQVK
jgi:hypothetical protein